MARCEDEVGPIPAFDCLEDGVEVPALRTELDGSVTALSYDYFTTGPGVSELAMGHSASCDAPTLAVLNNDEGDAGDPQVWACAPHDRLVHVAATNSRGEPYEMVAVCRNFRLRPARNNTFDELGIITYNRTTGATCFQSGRAQDEVGTPTGVERNVISGSSRPSFQDDPEGFLRHTELLPGGGSCLACHSKGPWVLNPYVTQLRGVLRGARFLRPLPRGAPFSVVEGEGLRNSYGAPYPYDGTAYRLSSSVAPACTRCHDLGSHRLCSELLDAAIGHELSSPYVRRYIEQYLSPSLRGESSRGWHMSLLYRNPSDRSVANLLRDYGEDLESIARCCGHHSDPSCGWTPTVAETSPGCDDLLNCLEGYGGAGCFGAPEFDELLECGQAGAGTACFERFCSRPPEVCPGALACWRAGGGAACFRQSRCEAEGDATTATSCLGAMGAGCTALQADPRTPNSCGAGHSGPAPELPNGQPTCVCDPEFRLIPSGGSQYQGITAGSLLHDQCCLTHPEGTGCGGALFGITSGICGTELARAVNDSRTDLRWWRGRFSPERRPEAIFGDDGELTAYGRELRAPFGVAVNADERRFCESGTVLTRRHALGLPFSICGADSNPPPPTGTLECSRTRGLRWEAEGFFLTGNANYIDNAAVGDRWREVVGGIAGVSPRNPDEFRYVTRFLEGASELAGYQVFVLKQSGEIEAAAVVHRDSAELVMLISSMGRYAVSMVDCLADAVSSGTLPELTLTSSEGVEAFWAARTPLVLRRAEDEFVIGGGSDLCGGVVLCLDEGGGEACFSRAPAELLACGRSHGGMACFERSCGVVPQTCAPVEECWVRSGDPACFAGGGCG